MAEYKVVIRRDFKDGGTEIAWEPGCPLLILAAQVSRNTVSGEAYLQLKLLNISQEIIGSFELVAGVSSADETIETVATHPLDADIAPGESYTPKAIPLPLSDVADLFARIYTITLENRTWHSMEDAPEEIAHPTLDLSEIAKAERRLLLEKYGKDPTFYERATTVGDGWWICSCGAPNVGSERCAICHLSLETALQLDDEHFLAGKAVQRNQEEHRAKKRKSAGIAATIAAILLAGCGLYFAFAVMLPSSQYDKAMELYQSGKYKEAVEAFSAIGDYSDTREMRRKAIDQLRDTAQYAYDHGNYKQARNLFGQLNSLGMKTPMEERAERAISTIQDLSPYLSKSLPGNFGLKNDLVDYEPCTMRLDENGTITLTIDGLDQEEFNGTWKGTWDPGLRTLHIPDFPGGEDWSIDAEDEVMHVDGSSRTKTGEKYLPIRSDTGYFFFRRG